MHLAPIALGFGLVVLASGMLATLADTLAAAVGWRWAQAIDRNGIDIHIKQDPTPPRP